MNTNQLHIRRRRGRKSRRGLTLIEILVVVTILGLIAGIVGITVAGQLEEAKVDTARVQIKNIGDALELYKVKLNKYPSTAEGLQALTSPPEGRKPMMETIPDDPFGNPYLYISPGTHNPSKFDLYSKGPDGVADTEDDITNWSR
jgi:general secretion pathway protein G